MSPFIVELLLFTDTTAAAAARSSNPAGGASKGTHIIHSQVQCTREQIESPRPVCEYSMYNRSEIIPCFWRSVLFWDITQHRMTILYGHFGTMYRSHLQGSRSPRRILKKNLCGLLDPQRWDRYVVPKRQ
jgi:hypothetical protein